ncbi:MAG: winged helix-turn-helix domain-containing protein [Bacteroidota bacterium]
MPRTLPLKDHLSDDEVYARFHACRDTTERARWQVIYLKTQHRTAKAIAEVTGYSPRWVRALIHRYNDGGPEALRDRRHDHPGAPAMLSSEQQADLDAALETGSAPDGGLWTGPKVARWIERATGRAHVHNQRGWEWMLRLGFSAQTPRPAHDGADLAAQAAFKK